MSAWKKIKEGTQRGGAVVGIITNLAGVTQAPPPTDMPDNLAKQYRTYSKEVRLNETRRDIRRVTSQRKDPGIALDKRTAEKLRGRR